MMTAVQPFPVPSQLPPTLASIHQYWKLLIRAENPMPFSDDVSLGPIEKFSAHLMLVDIFSGPQRFRFNRLGENIIGKLSNDLTGQFADEFKPAEPLNYFIAQASATIEAGAPTLYSAARGKSRGSGYSRLLLPAWGNGRIDLLLGAVI
ncbi:MAG: hypothetical protein WAR76_23300 [Xanthobacteraceae bacterium]